MSTIDLRSEDERAIDPDGDENAPDESHQHTQTDHNVVGVYGGAGYHRCVHGAEADEVILPGMRAYGTDEAPEVREGNPSATEAEAESRGEAPAGIGTASATVDTTSGGAGATG